GRHEIHPTINCAAIDTCSARRRRLAEDATESRRIRSAVDTMLLRGDAVDPIPARAPTVDAVAVIRVAKHAEAAVHASVSAGTATEGHPMDTAAREGAAGDARTGARAVSAYADEIIQPIDEQAVPI